jgi:hypothetical protein
LDLKAKQKQEEDEANRKKLEDLARENGIEDALPPAPPPPAPSFPSPDLRCTRMAPPFRPARNGGARSRIT